MRPSARATNRVALPNSPGPGPSIPKSSRSPSGLAPITRRPPSGEKSPTLMLPSWSNPTLVTMDRPSRRNLSSNAAHSCVSPVGRSMTSWGISDPDARTDTSSGATILSTTGRRCPRRWRWLGLSPTCMAIHRSRSCRMPPWRPPCRSCKRYGHRGALTHMEIALQGFGRLSALCGSSPSPALPISKALTASLRMAGNGRLPVPIPVDLGRSVAAGPYQSASDHVGNIEGIRPTRPTRDSRSRP